MLKLAIPNKGALSEDAVRLLGEAGYKCSRSGRELVVSDRVNDIDFVFLRPRDIALYVGDGVLDLGITGRDLKEDSGADVIELFPLGFGRSRFCFAVPKESGLTVEKLGGLRIATSYPELLRRNLEKRNLKCPIVRLDGAVEISIRLGVADAIADVVESGATLTVALYFYAKEQGEFEVAFAIAAILMFLTLLINFAADLVSAYFRRKKAM